MRDQREEKLIGQCLAMLQSRGLTVWRQQNSGEFNQFAAVSELLGVFAGLQKALGAGAVLKQENVKSAIEKAVKCAWRPVPGAIRGIPDIIGWMPDGRWLCVEVKIGMDTLRPEQVQFLENVRRVGGSAFVVRNIDSFREFLERADKKNQ